MSKYWKEGAPLFSIKDPILFGAENAFCVIADERWDGTFYELFELRAKMLGLREKFSHKLYFLISASINFEVGANTTFPEDCCWLEKLRKFAKLSFEAGIFVTCSKYRSF